MDENMGASEAEGIDYTELTADLVSAYVSNNPVPTAEMATLIATLHAALTGLGADDAPAALPVERLTPYRIQKSITHEALISFEDRKPYKTLKRHLAKLGLDPEAYRAKWGLPRDYPMVAAGYSEMRSAVARSIGLGQQRKEARQITDATETVESVAQKSKRAGRPRKAATLAEA